LDEKIILLVEDNPNDVLLTQRALKKSRILNKLVVAKDGVEALNYLFGTGDWAGRDLTDLPGVVLLDINLPKVNGLEVLKKIKEIDPTTEVIIVTAYATESSHANAITLGALEYLRKPFLMEEIYELVERAMRRKRAKASRREGEIGPLGSIH